jgi:hypothetical protein
MSLIIDMLTSEFSYSSTLYATAVEYGCDWSVGNFRVAYDSELGKWRDFIEIANLLCVSESFFEYVESMDLDGSTDRWKMICAKIVYWEFNWLKTLFPDVFATQGKDSMSVWPYSLLREMGPMSRKTDFKKFSSVEGLIPLAFSLKDDIVVDVGDARETYVLDDTVIGTCSRSASKGSYATNIVSKIDETLQFSNKKYDVREYDEFEGSGQVKLAIDMARFITINGLNNSQLGDACVLVVGASPFVGSAFVAKALPNIHFYLYDVRYIPQGVHSSNVFSVPLLDDDFVSSLHSKYKVVSLYMDIHDGSSVCYSTQQSYVAYVKPHFVRYKQILDVVNNEMIRAENSVFYVLPYARSKSVEFSEYSSSHSADYVVLDALWMEQYFIWYNSIIRKTRASFPSSITGCSCYDCMWVQMWFGFVFNKWKIKTEISLKDRYTFPGMFSNPYASAGFYYAIDDPNPEILISLGNDFTGERLCISTDDGVGFITNGFVMQPGHPNLLYHRQPLSLIWCQRDYKVDRYLSPPLFVVYDARVQELRYRYKCNFSTVFKMATLEDINNYKTYCGLCEDCICYIKPDDPPFGIRMILISDVLFFLKIIASNLSSYQFACGTRVLF